MTELIKLAVLLTFMCFALPILLTATFWALGAAAGGNFIPFIIFLVICLWAISSR